MSQPLAPVILTDGTWRKSLSAIRSLGKDGYPVTVLGDTWLTTGFWSTFTTSRQILPLASDDRIGFLTGLHALACSSPRRPILFLMEDAALMHVSSWRARFSQAADFLIPPKESLDIAQKKEKTMQFAAQLQVQHPQTWQARTVTEFLHQLQESQSFGERVVKPVTGSGSSGIIYDLEKSEDFWKQHWGKYGPLLIQQRIPAEGEALGVCLLFDRESHCVASFAHKRLQQYPNSGGPSTDRVAVSEPKLVAESIRFLKALNWVGVAMVEWKRHPETGETYLLEINPRFWGSLELAVRSGVNFPVLYAQLAQGQRVPAQHVYRYGTRCRWLIPGDVLRYINQPVTQRESIWTFFQGLPQLAEEWDLQDLLGTFSTVLCTGLLALQPRFWKYLRRG